MHLLLAQSSIQTVLESPSFIHYTFLIQIPVLCGLSWYSYGFSHFLYQYRCIWVTLPLRFVSLLKMADAILCPWALTMWWCIHFTATCTGNTFKSEWRSKSHLTFCIFIHYHPAILAFAKLHFPTKLSKMKCVWCESHLIDPVVEAQV